MSRKQINLSERPENLKRKIMILCAVPGCTHPAMLPDKFCRSCAEQIAKAETCPICGRPAEPGDLCGRCRSIFAPDWGRLA